MSDSYLRGGRVRIAYLVNQYPTVSHTFVRREIQELERLGHTVDRYSVRDTRSGLTDPLDREEWKRTHRLLHLPKCLAATARIAILHPRQFLRAAQGAAKLWRNGSGFIRHTAYLAEACNLAVSLSADVEHLHAHFGTNSTSVALLCHFLGGPKFSFTVHGPEEFDRPEAESLPMKIAHADFVVAVSDFGKAQLSRWASPESSSKIAVVRCGLSNDFLDRKIVPISDDRRLVCVARLSPQKGLFYLIAAAERLAKDSVEFELIIAGAGTLKNDIEMKISAAGLQSRVRMVGAQTGVQIQEWLESSRAFVLPSLAEGLPVVIMEAFALARPVITTSLAGIPELVVNGENGWLVPPASTDELTRAMRQALEASADMLLQMGLAGRQRVLESHTAAKQALQLAQLFAQKTLTSSPTGRGPG
jgi:glycosyltransferase involved in cell wall biosynthesis